MGMPTVTDDHVVLKYETHAMLENFPSNYLPAQFNTDKESGQDTSLNLGAKKPEILKFINTTDYQILDYSGIPSSATLMTVDSSPIEDNRRFK